MVRPYDPSEYSARHAFEQLPGDWQSDPHIQGWFEIMFDTHWDNYGEKGVPKESITDGARGAYNAMRDYIYREYDGADIDDYFDWQDWRDSYEAHSG